MGKYSLYICKKWGIYGEVQMRKNVKKSMGKGKKVLAFAKVLRHNSEARKRRVKSLRYMRVAPLRP